MSEQTAQSAFRTGQLLMTPGAMHAMADAGQDPMEFLNRHFNCDWGELEEEDKQENELSLREGYRLLSAYHTHLNVKLWVITEAADAAGNRAATTILLPSEY